MIGPVGAGVVGRTSAAARVRRRAIDIEDAAPGEGAAVGLEQASRTTLRAVAPGFEQDARGEDPRPQRGKVAAAALSAILGLKRGG